MTSNFLEKGCLARRSCERKGGIYLKKGRNVGGGQALRYSPIIDDRVKSQY